MECQDEIGESRWTYRMKRAVVLDLLCGKDSLAGLAHDYHLEVLTLLHWQEEVIRHERLANLHSKAS